MSRQQHRLLGGLGAAALALAGACAPAEQHDPPPLGTGTVASSLISKGTPQPTPSTPQAANIDCRTLPNPMYLAATTLIDTFLRKVAPVLANGDATTGVGPTDQMTVIHFPQASCNAYEVIDDNLEIIGTGVYYDAGSDIPLNCDLVAGNGIYADLVAMDVGGQTCLGATPKPAMVEFPSHVETLGFVVPKNSTQTSITATEAYYVMKFGGAAGNQIAPWTDPNFIHVRHGGSSTQLTIGSTIGLPGTMWSSMLQGNQGSTAVQNAIIADNANGSHEKSLGILNSSKWEASLNDMRVLAFEAHNQCLGGAVFPNATSASRDKRNVRDGHYPIWTNLRYILEHQASVPFSDNGATSALRAKKFVDLMTGQATATNLNVSLAVIQTGNVPSCAMHVAREFDGGDMKPFAHPAPCDCFFEASNGITNTACVACDGGNPCATGVCRSGFCEPR